MELLLNRGIFTSKSTIGELLVDGIFECFILEDCVRERSGVPMDEWKIDGETAIPQGRYRVHVNRSNRFSKMAGHDVFLPLLIGVPGYEGVRIHPGNTAADTEGCLLPGLHKGVDTVMESRAAFASLFARIQEALQCGEDVWLEIAGVPE